MGLSFDIECTNSNIHCHRGTGADQVGVGGLITTVSLMSDYPYQISENGGGGGGLGADHAPSRLTASVYLTLRLADENFIQCEVAPCNGD